MASKHVVLPYGNDQRFECEIDSDQLVGEHAAPRPNPLYKEELLAALRAPIEFPSVEQAVIPGDRVTLALDRYTPGAAGLVAGIWKALSPRGIEPDKFTVIQPASRLESQLPDPRAELPEEIRSQVRWTIHDPTKKDACVYLASTATGDRVYMARDVVDADFLMSAGAIAFDPLMGYRGTNSVFYPGLSSVDAMLRAQGQGHLELGPDESRPLRELIDEVGWLLGNPFTVQVIPAAAGGVSRVLAGVCEPVFKAGKKLLVEGWHVAVDERPDVVIAGIDHDVGLHAWEQLGAAAEVGRSLVARGGKIVILSDLAAELPEGFEMIRSSESVRDAIRPLRKQAPPDLVCA
ncbi:MAG TPA: lactate racemase domain-containing protein, partial [Planctomycetaceae bacterium]|nr:lactate racemase domain-containing protein [Planctomycetaceae bacterium]